MTRQPVLVIALESDLHADSVVHQLLKLGAPVTRIDPTSDRSLPNTVTIRFRDRCQAEYDFGTDGRLSSDEVTGVLCRFALEKLVPAEGSPLEQFSRAEEIAAFLAFLRLIDSHKWINDPWREARADCRILQAQKAREAGLTAPPFLVSSHYSSLVRFAESQPGGCVIKPISDAALARINGEFVEPSRLRTGQFQAPYAADFTGLSGEEAERVDPTPSLVQARIRKKLDIRATVVDDQVFAAAMPCGPDDPVDFRRSARASAVPFSLPEGIEGALVELVSSLGLRFASCDLVEDESGDLHFLESNVSGNWLWTELDANLAISRALAIALQNSTTSLSKPPSLCAG
jgi:hypothetical protein